MPLTYCIGEQGAETAWRETDETGAAVDWARVRGLPVSVAIPVEASAPSSTNAREVI